MKYCIIHDVERVLCFIGDTWHNHTQYNYWSSRRPSEIISLEEAMSQNQSWWDQRQFMCAVTNINFKKQVVESTLQFDPKWFSVIDDSSEIHSDVVVGKNTLVNFFNCIYSGNTLGDHVTVTNYVQLSHSVHIGDMCHVGPYSYLCFTTLCSGVCVGLRSSFPGKPNAPITVADWCNITMDSRVTKSITNTGTWYNNRKINNFSSLDVKIL